VNRDLPIRVFLHINLILITERERRQVFDGLHFS